MTEISTFLSTTLKIVLVLSLAVASSVLALLSGLTFVGGILMLGFMSVILTVLFNWRLGLLYTLVTLGIPLSIAAITPTTDYSNGDPLLYVYPNKDAAYPVVNLSREYRIFPKDMRSSPDLTEFDLMIRLLHAEILKTYIRLFGPPAEAYRGFCPSFKQVKKHIEVNGVRVYLARHERNQQMEIANSSIPASVFNSAVTILGDDHAFSKLTIDLIGDAHAKLVSFSNENDDLMTWIRNSPIYAAKIKNCLILSARMPRLTDTEIYTQDNYVVIELIQFRIIAVYRSTSK